MFEITQLLEATKGKIVSLGKKSLIKGISTDSRTITAGEAFIAIKGDNFDGHDFIGTAIKKGAACIIRETRGKNLSFKDANQQIPVTIIEVKNCIKALGDIANFHRRKFDIPVIAITGSTGKTTTKEMIAWILSRKFKVLKNPGTKNNHIGLPMTVLGLGQNHEIAVLELGTNHFGEIEYLSKICQPNIGIITNIGPAHLAYFHDLRGVFREKYSLIKNLKHPSIAIVNAEDGFLEKRMRILTYKPFMLGFGVKHRCEFLLSSIKHYSGKTQFCVNKKHKFVLKTLGLGNVYNALAAIVCGLILGITHREMASRLVKFEFPEGRLKLREFKLSRFIDDTYNSNPASLMQALKTLRDFKAGGQKIFVMGDMLELGKHARSLHYQAGLEAAKICDKFIAVGRLSRIAVEAAKKSGLEAKNIFSCDTSSQAREILFKDIAPDKKDIILVKGSRAMKMEEIFNNR